ncbi:DUF5825 family protein [Nonomuraea sp. B10E15]|uniref:DUF5825 family protein n=1 Tax=Nonomuraea sp. B10E15 TaxID=3153560 RepID=UPI00325F8E8F
MISATYAVRPEQLTADGQDLGLPPPNTVPQDVPDVAALWKAGYRAVFVDGRDGAAAADLCRLLASLRDLESAGFRIRWAAPATLLDRVPDWTLLTHLPAPESGLDAGTQAEWRAMYRFGRLRWFKGPGFIKIHDQRCDAGVVLTLTDHVHLDFVERASGSGVFRPDVAWYAGEEIEVFHDAGLMLRLDDDHVWLAGRVRRWSNPSQLMAP